MEKEAWPEKKDFLEKRKKRKTMNTVKVSRASGPTLTSADHHVHVMHICSTSPVIFRNEQQLKTLTFLIKKSLHAVKHGMCDQ